MTWNLQTAPTVTLTNVTKEYPTPSGRVRALRGVNFELHAGELVGVVGKSGSGKSTLLNVMTGIDRPTSGNVVVDGTSVPALSEGQLAHWRGRNVGIVFQFFQLLPTLTVAENVMLPMDFCGAFPKRERRARAVALLDRVGVGDQADKLPLSLSGGQQQRVAIARALANNPSLIVADEPTGNLDSRNGEVVWDLFRGLAADRKTVVVVTHDPGVAQWAKRVINIADGVLVSAVAPASSTRREATHA